MAFIVLWSYASAYQREEVLWLQVPVFALLGMGSGLTAYGFYRFRQQRPYIGATLLCVGFVLWGAFLVSFPWWETSEQLVAWGFFTSAILQLFIAIAMIILVLEEVRAGSQDMLHQFELQQSETDQLRSRILSSEERFRSLFHQASEAIVITAADDLHILELNQAAQRLLGLSDLAATTASLSAFFRLSKSADAPPQTGLEWFAFLSEQHRVEIVRADGSTLPAEVGGAPVEFGGKTAYQFFLREVTERVRLEQQLRQAEKLSALGQMISGIAHELNNPLAVIKGYLDLILSGHELTAPTRSDLEKVAHESNRAAKLVNNFLSFARERPAQRQAVEINQLVRRVIELREIELRILGVQTILQLEPELPTTDADAAQLEQVLVNLVSNALHALAEWPKFRRLKVSTSCLGSNLVIRVEDSGPGVPSDVLPHIFEPFFTTKQVGTGTGLGLSIAHSIVTEHNGRIHCERSGERGAAFVVELPIIQSLVPAGPPEEELPCFASNREPFATPSARVLVLDDEEALGEMLAELLSTLGHQAVTCSSAPFALELVQQQSFDLILSDYRMPVMNGREFYERLREVQPALAARVIFLTGDVVNQETRAFLESVGNPHLSKPFRLDAVAKAIRDVLEAQVEAEPLAVPA